MAHSFMFSEMNIFIIHGNTSNFVVKAEIQILPWPDPLTFQQQRSSAIMQLVIHLFLHGVFIARRRPGAAEVTPGPGTLGR